MRSELRIRPLRELVGIAAAIIAVWLAVGVFIASNFVSNASAFATPANFADVFLFQLSSAAYWAVFTPIIMAIVERLSFRPNDIARSLIILLIVIPLLAVVRAVSGGILLDLSEGRVPRLWMMEESVKVRFHSNIFIIAFIAGITRMMDAHRDHAENERRTVALETAVVDAEAERLRAQTQPSFLFGTLRAIRDRIRTDPGAADQMLVTLSDLLRRRLDHPAGRTVPLEEELELVERYLELQQIRFGTSTSLLFDVEEDVLNAAVPAFALQTLLETAMGEQVPSAVVVRGHARDGVLALEAHATPVQLTPYATGVAEERLRQWFGAERHPRMHRDGTTTAAFADLQLQMATEGGH